MGKTAGIFVVTMASIAQISMAIGQTVCALECPRVPVQFTGCSAPSVEHAIKDKIGMVVKVIKVGPGAYCKNRFSAEVLHTSKENLPSHIDIDFDPCIKWAAHDGDVINVYIWERASPNTGAYALAPCPIRFE